MTVIGQNLRWYPLNWRPADWVLLAAVLSLHWALAVSFHLSPDEAHYALYASRPNWSYYDHPPLVGWLQWPFLWLSGSDLAMRIAPMLAWMLTAWLLTGLTESLFQAVPRVWGMRGDLLLYSLSLLPHLLGIAWVPDSMLTLLTCAAMALTWRLCNAPGLVHTSRDWLLLGVVLGLAGLSKYTAVMTALGVALALFYAHGISLLRLRGLWLAVLTAGILVAPVFYWNATHDWMSFRYQLGHAQGGDTWRLLSSLRFMLVIWLAYGLLLPWCWVSGVRHAGSASTALPRISAVRLSLYFAVPSLLLWLYLSGRGSTLPHWAQPCVVSALPMATAGLAQLRRTRPVTSGILLVVQGILCLLFLGLMGVGGWSSEASLSPAAAESTRQKRPFPNPFTDLYGWDEAAQQAIALADANKISHLAVMNWTLASRLAWYARPWPVRVVDSHRDQFDLWFGTLTAHDDVLLVQWSQMPFDMPIGGSRFQSCERLAQRPVVRLSRQIAHFDFMLCRNWQPAPGGSS